MRTACFLTVTKASPSFREKSTSAGGSRAGRDLMTFFERKVASRRRLTVYCEQAQVAGAILLNQSGIDDYPFLSVRHEPIFLIANDYVL